MLNIVLFGAPGCGKGTQASRLREHYGINHVSTGEVIRAEIARGSELGRSMEEYIKSGRLAPDARRHRDDRQLRGRAPRCGGHIFERLSPHDEFQAEEFAQDSSAARGWA